MWVVCWFSAVLPYMALLQIHLSIYHAFVAKELQLNTARVLLKVDEVCFLLFIPLCLIAIANNAINYKGFHLWRFFAYLLFAKGCEIYFNFLMGKWPLG